MKAAIAVCVVFLAAVAYARPDQYTTRYDDVDLKTIVCNPKLISNYHKCLIGKGQCPPDGKELKANVPEAIQNGCGKCSEKQKEGSQYIIGYLYHHKPEMWKELIGVYDPENKYTDKYIEQLQNTPSDYNCD